MTTDLRRNYRDQRQYSGLYGLKKYNGIILYYTINILQRDANTFITFRSLVI